jgi:hypothetical protein
MKTILQKISLFVLAAVAALSVHAQTVEVSVTILGSKNIIANDGQFDASTYGDFIQGFFPLAVTIKNTSTTNTLTLTKVSGKYINLTGNGASDFTIDESALTGTLAPGASESFDVAISPSATNGAGKLVTLNLTSNDPSDNTYSGSIKYTFTNKTTAVTKASEIGLSLYPNPSNDGKMHVSAENVEVERIVVSSVSGQTEEFASKEFTTSLKGLLLVRLYTNKGVVSEKIIIQE